MTVATLDRVESLSADLAAALGLDESPLRIAPPVLWPAEGQCSVERRSVHLKVRVKLADAAPAWSFIHTHHQIGYRLSPEKRARRS